MCDRRRPFQERMLEVLAGRRDAEIGEGGQKAQGRQKENTNDLG
jgi:hypothetical protein